MSDEVILLVAGGAVGLLTLVSELAARSGGVPRWLARKVLHVGAIGTCALLPAFLEDLRTYLWIVIVVAPILLFLVARRILFSTSDGRPAWGIALFPLPLIALMILFANERWLIVWPMAILAVSDATAAVAGTVFARSHFVLTKDRKSFVGSAAFVVSVPVLAGGLAAMGVAPSVDRPIGFWMAVVGIGAVVAGIEALGSEGWDNVWVPLAAAALLQVAPDAEGGRVVSMFVAVAVAAPFTSWAVRRRSLSPAGAVGASILGIGVVWLAGPLWVVPLLFFFFSSRVIGRLAAQGASPSSAAATDEKEGRPRDLVQVLANGGPYGVLVVLYAAGPVNVQGWLEIALAASMAVSTSDTWSSEIGRRWGGAPLDLLRLRRVPAGLSGGVSAVGTVAGLLGAAAQAVLTAALFGFGGAVALIITAAGFSGMLFDSVLGSALQARYESPTGALTDRRGADNPLVGGFSWMTNDLVNLSSNVVVVTALAAATVAA